MLTGKHVVLRPMREADLDAVYAAHVDIANRGAFFPLGVLSEPASGGSSPRTASGSARRACCSSSTRTARSPATSSSSSRCRYWDAFELSYQLYDERFAGRGYVTEAVQLLVDYLFATKKQHRIHLVIVPENAASRRIAEKCGFVLEGTARGAFFNDGRNQDVRPLLAAAHRPAALAHGLTGADRQRVSARSGRRPT